MFTQSLDHTGHSDYGYLTAHEYHRFIWAWNAAGRIASFLATAGKINSSGEVDVRVHTSGVADALPSTWVAADEISSLLHRLNGFSEPEHVVNDVEGSELARELGRATSAADRRWPMTDRPHKVRVMRCGGCEELTLIYNPPRFYGDVIAVTCPQCDYYLPEDKFARAVAVIEAELRGESAC